MNDIYFFKSDIILQKSGKQILAFDAEESMLHTFNKTAGLLIPGLKKGSTISELAAILVKKFGIPESQSMRDIKQLVLTLEKKGLLQNKKRNK
ncbi:MAG: PqqD family protein [Candidatus Roizmanbacteria bacterium]|nr:PqqD family protein [Candidatus Roizmanbacteria bacterium]